MKKRLISIVLLIAFASMMHVADGFRIGEISEGANTSSDSQKILPIFDTHVHYKEPAWEVYPPEVILSLLKKSGVAKVLVSSTPDEGCSLNTRISGWIFPFVSMKIAPNGKLSEEW